VRRIAGKPELCLHCGGAMHIIAFITDGPTVCVGFVRLGEPTASAVPAAD
jgi:hypothetical protein